MRLGPGSGRLPGPVPAAVIAFLAGAGVLGLEITGARIFMPWFGSSVLVWSNVIGVTLGAVAVGNFLGGRIADRRPSAGILASLLVGAGLLAAAVPSVVSVVARRYLPDDLPLEAAFALMGRASLLAACLALGPPLVLLGVATPMLIRGALRDQRVGRAAGVITGAATVGSLVGTFLPVHVVIPQFGSRATCFLVGGFLALAGVISLMGGRATKRGVLAALVAAALLFASATTAGRAVERQSAQITIEELETPYQYARVERDADRTTLRINEGLDSFHSVTVKDQVLTDGAYFDYYNLFVPLAVQSTAPDEPVEPVEPDESVESDEPIDILLLGFAAGTIARQHLALFGDRWNLRIVGVELDPDVAALGHRHFGLPRDERIKIVSGQDARVYLDRTDRTFDLIIVDTYAQQVYIPFQMCSVEFFRTAFDHLNDGGILAANLGGFSVEDTPLRAIRNTAASVFGEVGILDVAGGRNFVLSASRRASAPDPGSVTAEGLQDGLHEIHALATRPGAFRSFGFEEGEGVLTDDHSPIELLADRDLLARSNRMLGRESSRAIEQQGASPFDPAIEDLRSRVEAEPESRSALWELGYAHWVLGNLDDSEAMFRRSTERFGSHAYSERMLGAVEEKRRRPEHALAHYARALALDPTLPHIGADVARVERTIADVEQFRRSHDRLGRDLVFGALPAVAVVLGLFVWTGRGREEQSGESQ